jgi:uncharacterized membrane protein YagU involved in acid resistance
MATTDEDQGALPRRVAAGALAGLVATVPMTATMLGLKNVLPPHRRYPLPPKQVTVELAEAVGPVKRLQEPWRTWLAGIMHFGFGGMAGAVYGPLGAAAPGPPLARGVAFGLLVWSTSYLGWLPAAGILKPATDQPASRNILMIAAHVVWGAALGLLADRWSRAGSGDAAPESRPARIVTPAAPAEQELVPAPPSGPPPALPAPAGAPPAPAEPQP